jgi:putative amidase-like protein
MQWRQSRRSSCVKERLFWIAVFFGLMGALLSAARADAISAPIHITGTAGEGVYIRPEPNTSRPPVGWMPEGASPDYNCFAWGQNIGGVPIWFNVNWGGVTGFYASYYDDSSYHSNEELTAKYGVPLCGASAPSPAPAPAPSPAPEVAPPASVGGLVFSVFNAEGGVYYRESPSWDNTKRIPGVGVYNGDQVELLCGAMGDSVGPYGNRAWSKVRNLTRPQIGAGWVNEHFINDGATANSFVSGEPMCGGGGSGEFLAAFDRGATVRWANAHARDTPPHPASCTWFVSQALWAGGLPKTDAWTSSGSHGRFQKRPGTVAAWAVPDFVNYILQQYPRSTFTQLNLRGNKVPAAQPGDVIAYDWYGKSSTRNRSNLQHLSVVTGIARGEYPTVSEWSIFDGTEPTPYVSRGWTWSEKNHEWLQEEFPQVQAFLLHIDTRS